MRYIPILKETKLAIFQNHPNKYALEKVRDTAPLFRPQRGSASPTMYNWLPRIASFQMKLVSVLLSILAYMYYDFLYH